MPLTPRFSDLSPARQFLMRVGQWVNHGQIKSISVRNGDPILDPTSTVLVSVKLDSDQTPRPETDLADFALPAEVCRLMLHLDELQNGEIESIAVVAGIPRNLVLRRRLAEQPQ